MKRWLIILPLLAALAPCGKTQQALDTYGGVLALACPVDRTNSYQPQLIEGRWEFCSPTNSNSSIHSHPFTLRGVWQVGGVGGSSSCTTCNGQTVDTVPVPYNTATHTGGSPKYPASPDSTTNWINAQYARLKKWGFNASFPTSYRPCGTDASITTANKMPCVEYMQQAANAFQHFVTQSTGKNIWNLRWPPGYAFVGGGARNLIDIYDTNFPSYISTAYAADSNIAAFKNSNYTIGFVCCDSDLTSGFAAGNDFPTDPTGKQWEHDSLWILMSAPHVWVNRANGNAIYASEVNQTKVAFQAFLAARYGTVGALNTAWNSTYTTLGSSGSQATGIALAGAGTGPYTGTLTRTTCVDRFGVLILDNGVAKGGDDGFGNLTGPGITAGTVNYATGAISGLTYSVAPSAPTANDYHDGYGCGTGFLDEWGGTGSSFSFTPAHCWFPTQLYAVTGGCSAPNASGPANFSKDMDDFLEQYGINWMKPQRDALHSAAPGKLWFTAAIGSVPYRSPGRCPLIKAAGDSDVNGTFADVLMISYDGSVAQTNFINSCNQNRVPTVLWYTVTANADSDWYAMLGGGIGLGTWDKGTQATRATQYATDMQNLWSGAIAGFGFWSYLSDSFFEFINFGLVSWRDNAYDSVENVTGSVSCSTPISSLTCGGEQLGWSAYGNFLGPVTTANQQIDSNVAGLNVTPSTVFMSRRNE